MSLFKKRWRVVETMHLPHYGIVKATTVRDFFFLFNARSFAKFLDSMQSPSGSKFVVSIERISHGK